MSFLKFYLINFCLTEKAPLGTKSFIQLTFIEHLQYCQALFPHLRYISEQVSLRPNLELIQPREKKKQSPASSCVPADGPQMGDCTYRRAGKGNREEQSFLIPFGVRPRVDKGD